MCGVKPYVLRYWEQEFTQLKPMKRRGNRRYYQHHEVLLIRRIRELLYEQGFTISGARNRLTDVARARAPSELQRRGRRRAAPSRRCRRGTSRRVTDESADGTDVDAESPSAPTRHACRRRRCARNCSRSAACSVP